MKALPFAGLLTMVLLWAIASPLRAQEIQLEVELPPPNDYFKVGEFKRIYDPSVGEKEPWYINDHCLIQEKESGKWHMFGITRQEPARPIEEIMFAHASADKLTQATSHIRL